MEKWCRTCLNNLKTGESVSVYLKILGNKSILNLIEEWALIKVAKLDTLPKAICSVCYETIQSFKNFILLIHKADHQFKKKLCKNNELNDKIRAEMETISSITIERQEVLSKKADISAHNQNQQKYIDASKNNYDDSFTIPDKGNIPVPNNYNKINLEQSLIQTKKEFVPYTCLTCTRTFENSYQYKIHQAIHTGEKKYACPTCGKCFSRRFVLIYHMRVHTGDKKFNCNLCSKSFIHPSNLYKHRKIHTNTRNYKCAYCNKTFIQSEALKIHIRRIHTGEKPFLCELCSKTFSSQSALWVHKHDTHEEKKPCKICKKEYSSRILKRHIERHKNNEHEVKKYICEQCGKNFSSDHNLHRHLLSHKGIKPYATKPIPCQLCKKSYSKRRITSHICVITE